MNRVCVLPLLFAKRFGGGTIDDGTAPESIGKNNSYLKVENRKLENERVIMDHKNPCQSHTPSIISECCGHKIHLSGSRTSLLPPAAFAGPRLDL